MASDVVRPPHIVGAQHYELHNLSLQQQCVAFPPTDKGIQSFVVHRRGCAAARIR